LIRLSKTTDVSTLIREIKKESSKWFKSKPGMKAFHWQRGYGAFSISPAHVDPVIEYIKNQKEHHEKESFQDEFRRLCKKYKIEIDERYVGD